MASEEPGFPQKRPGRKRRGSPASAKVNKTGDSLRLFVWRLLLILVRRLLSLLHLLLLLSVPLLRLLGLLLMALFDLLPSCFIGILLRQALMVLFLFLLELLMLLFLFGVELVLLLLVFPVAVRIARVWRSRPIVRSNFPGVSVGRTTRVAAGVGWTIGSVS